SAIVLRVWAGIVLPGPMMVFPFLAQTYIWAYQAVPPTVLVLGASRSETFQLRYRLERGLNPYRVVCLLDPELARAEISGSFQRNGLEWDNLRTSSTDQWRAAVHSLMLIASFIVLDARVGTPRVCDEVSHLITAGLSHKTLFVGDETGMPAVRRLRLSSPAA